jgi:hypothetical protein
MDVILPPSPVPAESAQKAHDYAQRDEPNSTIDAGILRIPIGAGKAYEASKQGDAVECDPSKPLHRVPSRSTVSAR